MQENFKDPYFRVEVISKTLHPQLSIFAAMRQDYIEELAFDRFAFDGIDYYTPFVCDQKSGEQIDEESAGDEVIRCLLKSKSSHWGPLEHPQIILNFGWFPHSVMQQIRTHRTGISFDVQSGRYTGKRIIAVANKEKSVEEVFYLRPVGFYTDRKGKKYEYTEDWRKHHIKQCLDAAHRYAIDIDYGMSEEHARGCIPFDVRQCWVMSANLRTILHLLDIRGKMDVQLECRIMTEMMFEKIKEWVPQIAEHYEQTRWRKGTLAP